MEHPHFSSECELQMSDGELQCDNTPRFRSPRLKDDGETLEVTCQMQAHTVTISALPDDTLLTVTRRLYEAGKDHRGDERDRLRDEIRDRGIDVPVAFDTAAIEWFVVELSEGEVRELESNGVYPEAYQMSQSLQDPSETDMWEQADGDAPRAMKVSNWALDGLPSEYQDQAVLLSESEYPDDYFG